MNNQQKITNTKKISIKIFSLTILIGSLIIATYSIGNINQSFAQTQTQTSVPHNAMGHESHQIVNLQNQNDSIIYTGTVTFNSSKPVDIISFKDVTNNNTVDKNVKMWQVDGKKLFPTTLLKNVTSGTISFEGNGILTHSIKSDPYSVTFTINATTVKTNNK